MFGLLSCIMYNGQDYSFFIITLCLFLLTYIMYNVQDYCFFIITLCLFLLTHKITALFVIDNDAVRPLICEITRVKHVYVWPNHSIKTGSFDTSNQLNPSTLKCLYQARKMSDRVAYMCGFFCTIFLSTWELV